MKQVVVLKLYPTKEQELILLKTMCAYNEAAAHVAQVGFENHWTNKIKLQKDTYYPVREEFKLPAQLAVLAIRKAAEALVSSKALHRDHVRSVNSKNKWRKEKGKKLLGLPEPTCPVFRDTGSITYDLRCLTYKGIDRVSLVTLEGRQVMPFAAGAYGEQKLSRIRGQADLVYRDKMWFLHATVDIPEPELHIPKSFLGVDMGVTSIAVDSDGKIHSAKTMNSIRIRYSQFRRKLQKKGTKAAKRLLKMRRRKEARFARNVNHCISKEIVQKAQRTERGIALEDLKGIRDRVTVRRAKRILHHSWSFHQLRSFIEYKAIAAGVLCVAVDPRNTSRECTQCGCIDKRNRKTQAKFCCISCGFVAHADTLAATNIGSRAKVIAPNISGSLA